MRQPAFSYAKTKAQISFAVTAKLISAFVFATRIVQSLFFFNLKFQTSSPLLSLYRPVCVRPVWKPHCWFSLDAVHLLLFQDTVVGLQALEEIAAKIYTPDVDMQIQITAKRDGNQIAAEGFNVDSQNHDVFQFKDVRDFLFPNILASSLQ